MSKYLIMYESKHLKKLEKLINQNFLIRYQFYQSKKVYLVGGGNYKNIVGELTAKEHFLEALNSGKDKHIIYIHKRLKTTFVSR